MSAWLDRGRSWLDRSRLGTGTRAAPACLRCRRVPILLQLSDRECGAACLAMVLSYHGLETSVAQAREQCGVGRDGLTARAIAEAARRYGLRVRAVSGEPAHFGYLPLPAIVHWNFNHFVVVVQWSPAKVTIVDPARGRRTLTTEEFDAGFTGVVLTLEPGVGFQRRRAAAPPSWRSYLGYLAQMPGTAGLLAQIVFASLLLQLFGLAVPLCTQVLVDHVLPFRVTHVMTMLGIGMMILVLAQMVTTYLRAALVIYLQARIDARLMLGFFQHLLTLPFRFFQQRTSGDLLMRLGSNAVLREMLTSQSVSAILDGGLVMFYLAILLARAPVFGFVVLCVGLAQVGFLLATTRPFHNLMQRDLIAQAESQGYLVEALTGIATLKASGAEGRALDHWSNLFFQQLNVSLQRNQLSAVIETGMGTLRTFSPLLLLWVGALRVLDGSMTLGTMLALNALAMSFLTPLASLVSSGQRLQLAGAHLERIRDVIEAEPEQDLQQVRGAPPLTGRIELEQVSFRYDRDSPPALRDISLTIEPGQKVALVGSTGSGKSTLAMLLLGLYLPTEGEIRYDGIPLHHLDYRTLRGQFGVVLQDTFLISGAIRENIAFNDPALSLEQVRAAARLADLDDEISQMTMGYETRVAEGGAGLSGGQRQRVTIARALAHRPAILVLDEATSHLDVVTESRVDENLSGLSCTRIVIAHRLSTVRNADLILVLHKGRIVEQGSHEELLARGSRYAALIHSQLGAEPGGAAEPERQARPVACALSLPDPLSAAA
jgi:ATP-binding cassette subfamily B protein